MQVLALDIGERRIGVASGSTVTKVATPVKVMSAQEVLDNAKPWRMLLQDYDPELLICGCPKSMSGKQGKQAHRVKDVAKRIADAAGLPLEFVDERLSSSEAKRYLREMGMSEKDMRGKVDSVAASIFLETWLAKQR